MWTGITRDGMGAPFTQSFSPPLNSPSDIGPWSTGQPNMAFMSKACVGHFSGGFYDQYCSNILPLNFRNPSTILIYKKKFTHYTTKAFILLTFVWFV